MTVPLVYQATGLTTVWRQNPDLVERLNDVTAQASWDYRLRFDTSEPEAVSSPTLQFEVDITETALATSAVLNGYITLTPEGADVASFTWQVQEPTVVPGGFRWAQPLGPFGRLWWQDPFYVRGNVFLVHDSSGGGVGGGPTITDLRIFRQWTTTTVPFLDLTATPAAGDVPLSVKLNGTLGAH